MRGVIVNLARGNITSPANIAAAQLFRRNLKRQVEQAGRT
jgi:ubiquitin-protein ligase